MNCSKIRGHKKVFVLMKDTLVEPYFHSTMAVLELLACCSVVGHFSHFSWPFPSLIVLLLFLAILLAFLVACSSRPIFLLQFISRVCS